MRVESVSNSTAIHGKVDVGFVKPDKHKEIQLQTFDSSSNLRLEALKLAYEFSFKTGTFDYPEPFNRKNLQDQLDAYKQVFELADINYQFITVGKVTIPDEDDAR